MFIVIVVFACTYFLIVFGLIHRTVAALAGALTMLAIGAIRPVEAFWAVDFDTLGLLTGMMIIVGITRTTGVFEYLAVKAAKIARGEPVGILAALCLITAVLSAFLDNVTTVMLIIPITFAIARRLEVNPVPYLMAIIIASNIGGAATMVGDPPNIMISGFTGLGFMDFVTNLAPAAVVVYIVTVSVMKSVFSPRIKTIPALKGRIRRLKAEDQLKDRVLLGQCSAVVIFTVLGFVLHRQIDLEPAFIAVVGAVVLLLITNHGLLDALRNVEWSVIIFFASLFVMVGALDKTGVFERLAGECLEITGGDILLAAMLILWVSAIASALIDNIPFVAAMIPLIHDMGRLGGFDDLTLLWWSLSLGSCFGGNGTAIGASANVVVIGLAEKSGVHISYLNYLKIGFPLMILSIVISTVYLLFWYYLNVN